MTVCLFCYDTIFSNILQFLIGRLNIPEIFVDKFNYLNFYMCCDGVDLYLQVINESFKNFESGKKENISGEILLNKFLFRIIIKVGIPKM